VEIAVPAEAAPAIWESILDCGVTPAGLAARDTLRLEAGLPLHGNEIGPDITPLQAGLGWVVAMDTPFIGREAIIAESTDGPHRVLRGLDTAQRRPIRHGYEILHNGVVIAQVASGNYVTSLGRAVGMALLPVVLPIGATVDVRVRGTDVPATVVDLPFTT
jgi:aminomethyltransferase